MPAHFTSQSIRLHRESITPSIIPPNRFERKLSLNTASSGAKRGPTPGLCVGQIATPGRATYSFHHSPYGGNLFQIPLVTSYLLPKFPPSPPSISVYNHQNLQNHIFCAPSQWLHSNVAFSTPTAAYESSRYQTNYDLFVLIKESMYGPSDSMWSISGLIWASAPSMLYSSLYHDWSNPGYSPQT